MKKATAKQLTPPTLDERLAAVLEEIDAVIDAHVDAITKVTPGVPRGVIDQMIRKHRCACAVYRTIKD